MALLVFIQCCIILTLAPDLPLHAALVSAALLLTLRHKPNPARHCLALSLIPPVSSAHPRPSSISTP